MLVNGSGFDCENNCVPAKVSGIKWHKVSQEYRFQCSCCARWYALSTGGRVTRIYLAKEEA